MAQTVGTTKVLRDERGRLLKGTSNPNPGGRGWDSFALARRAAERFPVDMLLDVAEAMLRGEPIVRVMRDGKPAAVKEPLPTDQIVETVWPDMNHRMKALEWISDRTYSKPPQEHNLRVAATEGPDFAALSDEQLDKFLAAADEVDAALATKALAAPAEDDEDE